MSRDAKTISWRRSGRDKYITTIGGIELRIQRNGPDGWTLAIVAALSTGTSASPVLIQRALSASTDDHTAAQRAALRVAEETLEPIAEAYSDIAEWAMYGGSNGGAVS